jgi:hypothetical protein
MGPSGSEDNPLFVILFLVSILISQCGTKTKRNRRHYRRYSGAIDATPWQASTLAKKSGNLCTEVYKSGSWKSLLHRLGLTDSGYWA